MANAFAVENTQKTYINFPNDVYVPVCLIGWRIAYLPPGPLSASNEPVKSAQFLFAGYVPCGNIKPGDKKWQWPENYTVDPTTGLLLDDIGARVVARKWSKWMRISLSERSAMCNTFQDFDNFGDMLLGLEDPNGSVWKNGMTILLEKNNDFQNVIRIKPDDNTLSTELYYDDKYIPYKVTKAYGQLRELALAGCKFKSGVKVFNPDEMTDATHD